ncbi:class I SAM-dependent methyltransferase [Staphylococcus aureus]|nr:class I SAM-dependent methyltransferase [Staphylococcus aureus]MBH4648818.1 class I SAM-dependent methyltransferase [Staphylococcus aureus]MBH4661430.1 class I SAM-dependent methyltransferase [Staphylococcus aureus]MBH4669102.1 class I SAM-dependent methyltransferase [Staphylococcus aureus]MBH4671613.1 class I SAM-dependent methyltransferase [Staphylococcus aureus]
MKRLDGIPESMLIPLIARAKEYEYEKPIIKDALSKKIFDGLDDMYKNVTCDDMSQIGISIRSVIIDSVTKRLIKDNKNLIVVNIGCGLDTRFHRFNKEKISWIDLDVPESIEIRKTFFKETDSYKMIAKSMLDYSWIEDVKNYKFFNSKSNILFIFEGVLMYFDESVMTKLLHTIIKKFGDHNLTFAIEFCSTTIANNTKRHKSVSKLSSQPVFKYGYNDLNELDKVLPNKMKVINEYNYFDYHKKRWGLFGYCRYIPYLKKRLNNKIVIMEYKPAKLITHN